MVLYMYNVLYLTCFECSAQQEKETYIGARNNREARKMSARSNWNDKAGFVFVRDFNQEI